MYSLLLVAVVIGSVSSFPYDDYDHNHDGLKQFGVQECLLVGVQNAISCYFMPTPTSTVTHKSLGDQPEDFQKYVSPELKQIIYDLDKLRSSTLMTHSGYSGLGSISEDICYGHVLVDTLGCLIYVESLPKPNPGPEESTHYYEGMWNS